jgi:hypothetical protein
MPRGRVLYVPETSQGRLVFLGQEIPIRTDDVPGDARRPGARGRFDHTWDGDDLCASNVRRARGPWARERWDPAQARGPSMGGGSER